MPRMSKWYSFKSEQVDLAPEKAGAYQLAYKDVVVYIGSAESSIRSRLREHRKRKTFMKVTHFRFCKTDSEEARATEAKLCKEFVRKNGKLPRLQKAAPKDTRSYIDRLIYG